MPRVYPPIEGKTSNQNVAPSIVEATAGFSAGVVSTLAVHPFDVVKTRLQGTRTSQLRSTTLFDGMFTIDASQSTLKARRKSADLSGFSKI